MDTEPAAPPTVPSAEAGTAPPLLLAGEESDDDPHIVRGID